MRARRRRGDPNDRRAAACGQCDLPRKPGRGTSRRQLSPAASRPPPPAVPRCNLPAPEASPSMTEKDVPHDPPLRHDPPLHHDRPLRHDLPLFHDASLRRGAGCEGSSGRHSGTGAPSSGAGCSGRSDSGLVAGPANPKKTHSQGEWSRGVNSDSSRAYAARTIGTASTLNGTFHSPSSPSRARSLRRAIDDRRGAHGGRPRAAAAD